MGTRIGIIAFFVGAVALVGLFAAFRSAEARQKTPPAVVRPAVVRCAPLEERKYTVNESFHGLIHANVRVDLAFQIAGRVSQLGPTKDKPLKENDPVEPGQVLAMLEPMRYQAAIEQANASMEEGKAALASGQAAVADAQARLDDAKQQLDRAEKLRTAGAANPREVDVAQTAMKVAQAQLDSAKAKLASATALYESSRAAATMANINLQDATLKAPIKGVVADVPVELGQMVTPAQPVATLVDLSKVKLVVGVVERKLPLLKKGQTVSVEVQALASRNSLGGEDAENGKPRAGTITLVPPAADPVTGLFNVEVELPNGDGQLRPGMVGKATVQVMERTGIAVAAEAVTRSGDQYTAFFVTEGYEAGLDLGALGSATMKIPTTVAKKVTFKPVAIDRDYYLLDSPPAGLSRLVVEGQNRLADGEPVKVIDALAQTEPPSPQP